MEFVLVLLILLLIMVSPTAADDNITLEGYPARCGNISIPYPFFFTARAVPSYYLSGFGLFCNRTTIMLFLAVNDTLTTEVVTNISLDPPQVMIHVPLADTQWLDLEVSDTPSPYTLSMANKFYLVGSNVSALLFHPDQRDSQAMYVGTNCSSHVYNTSSCGFGCCSTSIPPGMKSYTIDRVGEDNSANKMKAFLSSSTYTQQDLHSDLINASAVVPVLLDWNIPDPSSCDGEQGKVCISANSHCVNQMVGLLGYHCQCSEGYQGNPYIHHGCQDIDECSQPEKYACNGMCSNSIGNYSCVCPPGAHGNPTKESCYPNKNQSFVVLVAIIGVSIGMGLLLLSMGALFLYRRLQKKRLKMVKEKHFRKNRGLLLQQLISHEDVVERTKIFSLEELEKATNNFDDSRILGRGGHGTVFKGILLDQRVVAIKKSKIAVQSEIDQFINEVVILSQLNHRNVVKLFGCCLETEVPLLVYEFVSNGTLSDHIHLGERTSSLSWGDRLKIAREAAGALAYLHCAASISIFHRDVKSSNILLDESCTAKVSDFGASRSMPIDQTRVVTVVQGTFGYLDPEYYHTCQLTQKSDVYSFGVILVELLMGEKSICFNRAEDERNLSIYFLSSLRDGRHSQIVEARVIEEATREELDAVAKLAEMCLRLKGERRSTMKEVEASLGGLTRFVRQEHEDSEGLRIEQFDANYRRPTRNSDESENQEMALCLSLEKRSIMSLSFPR